ncbi:MAG: molybdopterin dinucleotide-binding protein, partial [Alphaproteobacteria bacterium]|nr:molybdopterin dinucleotide-binding protein [Alphaproteobacteria bacterium]
HHHRVQSPGRLRHSLKRRGDGSFAPIPVDDAIDEIARHLERIIDARGPDAVAMFLGTSIITHSLAEPFANAFMAGLGSPMTFITNSIDKPGKNIARHFHGTWQAPAQNFDNPDVALLFGANPFVSYEGHPTGTPGWLVTRIKAGMKLIVIDPRRTETARRAALHLQARPGTDNLIVAGMLRYILDHDLHDAAFCAENVDGLEALRAKVAPFTFERVAAAADVRVDDLVTATRIFAGARRSFAFSGTGSNMSSPDPLNEYLMLCLDTLCGRWLRAGEVVRAAPTVSTCPTFKAQASKPRPARYGVQLRVRGLTETAAGLPSSALADEILLEGKRQIRALISCAGNPVAVIPDHQKVVKAAKDLGLFVQVDPFMTQSAQLAHYVIAPKMSLETPDTSRWADILNMWAPGFGAEASHGQYTPAVLDVPAGSDLIEEWRFFFRLAKRMGRALNLVSSSLGAAGAVPPLKIGMDGEPSTDDMLAYLTQGSRVPLDEVKRYPDGRLFPSPEIRVGAKDPGHQERLDVGNGEMMDSLTATAAALDAARVAPDDEMRLVCRRVRGMYNSWLNDGLASKGVLHNAAYVHPEDLRARGLRPGDLVELSNDHGAIRTYVEEDDTLRRGLVSIGMGFGTLGDPLDPARGGNVNILIPNDRDFDPYSGMPRMSNIPVKLSAVR